MNSAHNNKDSTAQANHTQSGFTLTELMIAVLIIGILSAIALPSYQAHVAAANRTDATTMLIVGANQQEQFFIDNKTYSLDMTELGFATNPASTENDFYLIKVRAETSTCAIQTCYVLEASLQVPQPSDGCGTLTLDSLGNKQPSNCW